MKLFEINTEILACLENAFDHETGEVIDADLLTKYEQLQVDLEVKALDTACYIKGLLAEAEAVGSERKRLQERESALKNRAESLKNYLAKSLGTDTKFEDGRAKISWRKSTSVQVLADKFSDLPESYVKWEWKPNKLKIREDLKAGINIPSCSLFESQHLQIK